VGGLSGGDNEGVQIETQIARHMQIRTET